MTFLKEKSIDVIAEIGVNHEGNIDYAAKLLELAAQAGASYVKFQSYTPSRYAAENDSARLNRVRRRVFINASYRGLG